MSIFMLLFPFIALSGDPGAAFDKQLYPTVEDCRRSAEEKINQAKRKFREVKAVCVPFNPQSLDMEEPQGEDFQPNSDAKVGNNT